MTRDLSLLAIAAAIALGVASAGAAETAPVLVRSAALDNPLAAHPLSDFAGTLERPLFNPDRRQPAPPTPPLPETRPAAAPPAPPDIALFGTVVDNEGVRATIRNGPNAKTVAVRIGDEVDGWKVEWIAARQIVLALDDRSVTVTMFDSNHAIVQTAAKKSRLAPVVEVNAAGVLRATRIFAKPGS